MNNHNLEQSNNSETTLPQKHEHEQDEEPQQQPKQVVEEEVLDEELHKLLVPKLCYLPITPPSAIEANFDSYFAPGFFLN